MTTGRTRPAIDGMTGNYAVSKTKDHIRCPRCTHIAYKTGDHEWTCACQGQSSECHGYLSGQSLEKGLVRVSYIIRDDI